MKKALLSLVLASVLAGGLFAQAPAMTWGVGGMYSGDFGSGYEGTLPFWGTDMSTKMPSTGIGAYAFFDAKYLEVTVGYLYTFTKWDIAGFVNTYIDQIIDIALWGKYPFALGEKVALFPLLGVEYKMYGASSSEAEKASDFNALWFKGGIGADFGINDKMFIRSEALYGIKLKTKFEKDMADTLEDGKARLGHGLDIKVAVGWKI